MTGTSSEYGFPIFISSTDYNLIDLRAELAKYLAELGYRPILSSSDGFHDNSPELEPWESCLQVLQTAYVMVLVIDGKYGEPLEWKNFASIVGDRKVSPTHAEYLFAHKSKMRMLVFIRKEILTYYQSYRTALKIAKGEKALAKENLLKTLPKHIQFETLEFVEEVKTTRSIPWIKPFENVTDIKQEIQKKMLNELAELFLFKNKHLESVVRAFSSVLDDLPPEKRKETLEKIGATKELVMEVETQTKVIQELKKEKEILVGNLKEKGDEFEKAQKEKGKETKALKNKIKELTDELESVESRINTHELNTANNILWGATGSWGTNNFANSASGFGFNPITFGTTGAMIEPISASVYLGGKCDKCGGMPISTYINSQGVKTCPSCKRKLCQQCFDGPFITLGPMNKVCEDCRSAPSELVPAEAN
jgi:hypothetical protein